MYDGHLCNSIVEDDPMSTTLLSAGLACGIAAIIGGGLRAFGIEFPVLQSVMRQIMLGSLGLILIALSFLPPASRGNGQPHQSSASTPETSQSSPTTAQSKDKHSAAMKYDILQVTYDGATDIFRRQVRTRVHTPNNNSNRGSCPNEVGHADGKWCTSRTPLSLTTEPPFLLRDAKVSCRRCCLPLDIWNGYRYDRLQSERTLYVWPLGQLGLRCRCNSYCQ